MKPWFLGEKKQIGGFEQKNFNNPNTVDNPDKTDIVITAYENGGKMGDKETLVGESRIVMLRSKKNLNNSENPDNPKKQIKFGLLGKDLLGLVRLGLVCFLVFFMKSKY